MAVQRRCPKSIIRIGIYTKIRISWQNQKSKRGCLVKEKTEILGDGNNNGG
jgi:hypothetical protein